MEPTKLRLLISQQEISGKIRETAIQIKKDFEGKDLCIIMVLKGALCLTADLIRELDMPLNVEVVQCSSYGALGAKAGELQIIGLDRLHLQDKDVLVIDDIYDTGHTMGTLLHKLHEQNPRSLQSCVLLNKKVPKTNKYRPEYVLFDIENFFVVGYGLDYKEDYRGLPGIYIMKAE